jgi:copper transport protein
VIAVTGIGMTLKFLPSFSMESLLMSDWGKTLLLKVFLFIGMTGIGYLQRHSLKKISLQGLHTFIRRGRVELLYGVLILFAAAVLIESSPVAAEQGVYSISPAKDGTTVSVKITPFRAGKSDIDIGFQNQPELKQVRVYFYMPPDFRKENTAFSLGNRKLPDYGKLSARCGIHVYGSGS